MPTLESWVTSTLMLTSPCFNLIFWSLNGTPLASQRIVVRGIVGTPRIASRASATCGCHHLCDKIGGQREVSFRRRGFFFRFETARTLGEGVDGHVTNVPPHVSE